MTPVFLSPDCRDENHQKCDLQAWDDIDDVLTDCGCDCHQGGAKVVAEDGPELSRVRGGERVYRPGEKP